MPGSWVTLGKPPNLFMLNLPHPKGKDTTPYVIGKNPQNDLCEMLAQQGCGNAADPLRVDNSPSLTRGLVLGHLDTSYSN